MTIGYVIEDNVHEAVLKGLQSRTPGWCPGAPSIRGHFRGTGRGAVMRDARKVCIELNAKGAQVIIILVDSDVDAKSDIKRQLMEKVSDFHHMIVVGIAERNIECWLNADVDYLSNELGVTRKVLEVEDPKPVVHAAISGSVDKQARFVQLVTKAPLKSWIKNSASFKQFYNDARDLSQRMNCSFPNELEN